MKAAIILVRLDSRRFPQKAFAKLGGINLIEYPIRSLLKDNFFTPIIATTDRAVDDPLVQLAKQYNIRIFRGDLENVSKRVIDCLKFFKVSEFARINGDSPFVQLGLLKSGYKLLKKNNYDFVTNLYPRSFPYGISLELFQANIFINNMEKVSDQFLTENITPYFYENINRFKYENIVMSNNKNYQDVRLTVDRIEDLNFIQKMIDYDKLIFNKNIEQIVSVYKIISESIN